MNDDPPPGPDFDPEQITKALRLIATLGHDALERIAQAFGEHSRQFSECPSQDEARRARATIFPRAFLGLSNQAQMSLVTGLLTLKKKASAGDDDGPVKAWMVLDKFFLTPIDSAAVYLFDPVELQEWENIKGRVAKLFLDKE